MNAGVAYKLSDSLVIGLPWPLAQQDQNRCDTPCRRFHAQYINMYTTCFKLQKTRHHRPYLADVYVGAENEWEGNVNEEGAQRDGERKRTRSREILPCVCTVRLRGIETGK